LIKEIEKKAVEFSARSESSVIEDARSLRLLIVLGIAVSIFYWRNATLVYDDIAFPYSFSALVGQSGWAKTLVKIFCLDLPNEYRSYGISRVIQFLLWSVGIESAKIYSLIISATQLATASCLYVLFRRFGVGVVAALSSGFVWILSPFIWTSCFHHYSYLILPFQVGIIGLNFLIFGSLAKRRVIPFLFLGVVLGLTGEMHLLPISVLILAAAWVKGGRLELRAAWLTIFFMVLAVLVHFSVWKVFVANPLQPHRFNLSLSHDVAYWVYRLWVAMRGIDKFLMEQLNELVGSARYFFAGLLAAFSLAAFLALRWAGRRVEVVKNFSPVLTTTLILYATVIVYFAFYVLVVVLTDSVPPLLPRRYGYIPFALILVALCLTFEALLGRGEKAIICSAVLVGLVCALFFRQQFSIVPAAKKADEKISGMIAEAIKKSPGKAVVFFASSEKDFPLTSIGAATLGPAMRDVASAELSQAKYGTYWPAFINITRVLSAPYTCELGGWRPSEKLALICPTWQSNPGVVAPSDVIVVANLGFEARDPQGKNVRVFSEFDDFRPNFFSKHIDKNIGEDLSFSGEEISFDLGNLATTSGGGDAFPDKALSSPLSSTSTPWLKNYGWVSGDDRIYKHPSASMNSDYYRTNRNGNFVYRFEFSPSDVRVSLDFWELWKLAPGQRNFKIEVSWDDERWVSLGEIDPALINGRSPFAIVLSRQGATSLSVRTSTSAGSSEVPFLQGIRIGKKIP
jgi:hypothetical protein